MGMLLLGWTNKALLFCIMAFFPQHLAADEETQIRQQFKGGIWRHNSQVLWSGIYRDEAQRWADEHEMQTLTTAMGPLMDPSHPLCLKNKKTDIGWSKYVKGASAIFACYISRGEKITVLSPPPPERFHPSGLTSYQTIEEPIVKGKLGTDAVSRIEMVHPKVKGAEDFCYQIWPVDETSIWTAKFGEMNLKSPNWRMVKNFKSCSKDVEITKTGERDLIQGLMETKKEKARKEKIIKKKEIEEKEKAEREKEKAEREKEKAEREKEKAEREKEKAEREKEKVINEAAEKKKKEKAEKKQEKAQRKQEKAEREQEKVEKKQEKAKRENNKVDGGKEKEKVIKETTERKREKREKRKKKKNGKRMKIKEDKKNLERVEKAGTGLGTGKGKGEAVRDSRVGT